jgi:hypothetical protein
LALSTKDRIHYTHNILATALGLCTTTTTMISTISIFIEMELGRRE